MQIGSTHLTSSGLVNGSGPTRVFALIFKSGGTAGVLAVLNGTAGTEQDSITGTINTTAIRSYPGGLLLGSGCYLTIDVNTTYVTVIYAME